MIRKYPNLCSPLKIGNITLRNRMVSAPMAFPDITAEGHVTREAAAFYELRARGGAAAVTLSECIVHIRTGMSHSRHINLESEGVLAGLTEAARSIKRHGAVANVELSHGGDYCLGQGGRGGNGAGATCRPVPAQEGRDVRVVEMTGEVAIDANIRQRPILLEMLKELNVKIEIGMKGVEITEEGLICVDRTGDKRLFEADTIVIAAGSYPLRKVVNGLLDAAPEVIEIGDCVRPQKVTEALCRGYHAGLDI